MVRMHSNRCENFRMRIRKDDAFLRFLQRVGDGDHPVNSRLGCPSDDGIKVAGEFAVSEVAVGVDHDKKDTGESDESEESEERRLLSKGLSILRSCLHSSLQLPVFSCSDECSSRSQGSLRMQTLRLFNDFWIQDFLYISPLHSCHLADAVRRRENVPADFSYEFPPLLAAQMQSHGSTIT